MEAQGSFVDLFINPVPNAKRPCRRDDAVVPFLLPSTRPVLQQHHVRALYFLLLSFPHRPSFLCPFNEGVFCYVYIIYTHIETYQFLYIYIYMYTLVYVCVCLNAYYVFTGACACMCVLYVCALCVLSCFLLLLLLVVSSWFLIPFLTFHVFPSFPAFLHSLLPFGLPSVLLPTLPCSFLPFFLFHHSPPSYAAFVDV